MEENMEANDSTSASPNDSTTPSLYKTPEPTDVAQSSGQPVSSGTGKRVLCIEDEAFIGDLYKHALLKAGYQADIINDGKAGLEMAQTGNYDIILLDIVIPQLLGIDVLHELRKNPNLKSKIIIATNLEQDDETRAAVEKEADAYIIKAEITPSQLVEFLKNF